MDQGFWASDSHSGIESDGWMGLVAAGPGIEMYMERCEWREKCPSRLGWTKGV